MATPDTSPSTHIEPLTHRNRDGAPYERAPQVERQLQAAVLLSTQELIARARIADRADPAYLQEEALAYFIRRAHRAADDRTVDGLSEVLVGRCVPAIGTQLRALSQDRREEAVAETLADLFELLLEPEGSDRGDFLQVRFWRALQPLRIAAFNRAAKASNRTSLLVAIDPTGAGAEDEEEHRVEVSDPRTQAPDTQLLTDEALARLEPDHRQAFVMRLEGWPVEDRDPSVPTISGYFGKTSRTIRNWLALAEEQLAAWRDEEARA